LHPADEDAQAEWEAPASLRQGDNEEASGRRPSAPREKRVSSIDQKQTSRQHRLEEETLRDLRAASPETEEDSEHEAKEGVSIWDLLRDEVGAEEWEGWAVDGKWLVLSH
jgi:hypothetical protein